MNPPERETHESATIAEPMAAGRAKRRRRRRQNIVSAVGVASLLCLLTAPSALAADSVNWANAGGNKISFANLDGSDGGDLNTTGATVSGPVEVAIDPAA